MVNYIESIALFFHTTVDRNFQSFLTKLSDNKTLSTYYKNKPPTHFFRLLYVMDHFKFLKHEFVRFLIIKK